MKRRFLLESDPRFRLIKLFNKKFYIANYTLKEFNSLRNNNLLISIKREEDGVQ
jgi:hypothetical protein